MTPKPLSSIIPVLKPVDVLNFKDIPIEKITCIPENLTPHTLYGVIDEFLEYGHWIEGKMLWARKSSDDVGAIITDSPLTEFPGTQLLVRDARKAVASAAGLLFNSPDRAMNVVAVTGTNGKTTTTHLVHQILTALNIPAAALGTIGVFARGWKMADTVYTTALSPELFETLGMLRDSGIQTVAMEVSSHAIKLDRVYGIQPKVGVFTNFSRDHLDFHETMADYRETKKSLFTRLPENAVAVLNFDEKLGNAIACQSPCSVIGYGCRGQATLAATRIICTARGSSFSVTYNGKMYALETSLVGLFNIYNLLAAIGACLAMGITMNRIARTTMGLKAVGGRFEQIELPNGAIGIVDYAHTPDSLEKVLKTIRDLNPCKVITVFGCGGDRDRGKRPFMGKMAAAYSDVSVVTSDNPRREDPKNIIGDILEGMPKRGVVVEPDRREAILKAYDLSRCGDVILLAGKGHETYQIIGDNTVSFDDREELRCLK